MNPNPTITLALPLDRINMLLQAMHGQTQTVCDDIAAQCTAWMNANPPTPVEVPTTSVDAQPAVEVAQ